VLAWAEGPHPGTGLYPCWMDCRWQRACAWIRNCVPGVSWPDGAAARAPRRAAARCRQAGHR